MRITVLGGAGKMGCISVQGLAGDPRVDEIVLADLDSGHAEIVTSTIKSPKIKFQQVDLEDEAQLDAAFQGSDVCLNARHNLLHQPAGYGSMFTQRAPLHRYGRSIPWDKETAQAT
jgi:saccharopine dehydrogenase-like NADP-dependent oxidoreductase